VDTPTLLNVKQVAAALGCTPDHVYRLVRDGRIPVIRVGAGRSRPRLRFIGDEVIAALRDDSTPENGAAA
jgi:excisionase family DNA binding protein